MEADAVMVGLETVFFEVPLSIAQLTDMDEGAGLDVMSLLEAPGALVTELFVCPVPRDF
jgi:hypothetical protein